MKFLTRKQIEGFHKAALADHGGSGGLRDEGMLKAAIAMPQATFGGELLHPTIAEASAAYLYHLCQNHPFVDGNKRVAVLSAVVFAKSNGYVLALENQDLERVTLDVAAGKLDKRHLTSIFEVALREEKV